ncbi:MAG: hypothetical protein KAU21_19620 [Gammaproteobacteria bacterium]|nr:hypothetical protein [Gammaproteobacteria bacterium]
MITDPRNPDYDTRPDEQAEADREQWLKGLKNFNMADVLPEQYPEFVDAFIDECDDEYGNPLSLDELNDLNENHPDIVHIEAVKAFNDE